MKSLRGIRIAAVLAACFCVLGAGAASAQQCPVGGKVDEGYTIHMKSEEAFVVDKIVDDVVFMRHTDNRGNTLNSQELYRGLFTLATLSGKGRTVYSYDVDPATFFPIHAEGYATVGGMMMPETGRPSRVERSWRISGAGTKYLNSGVDREFMCLYNVRTVEAITTWPDLGLEFRQEKLWAPTLNMVLYLKTEVWERGVQTRVTVFDADWITE
jgi:hypothetical protein